MSDDLDEEVRLTLRLPSILRNRIFNETHRTGRSLNAEIVYRLEKSLTDANKVGELEDQLAELWGRLETLESRVEDHDRAIFPQRHDWK